MTRIVINCPKCYKQITLSAHSNVRIIAKEKAVHVHEDLEKEGKITSPPRFNKRMAVEAVMTSFQPRPIFDAVRAVVQERQLWKHGEKLSQIFQSGWLTHDDCDAILKAVDEVK